MSAWDRNSSSHQEYKFNADPYDTFMRKHLQHYGYYTGKNEKYRSNLSTFSKWDKNYGYDLSSDSDPSDSEYENQALQKSGCGDSNVDANSHSNSTSENEDSVNHTDNIFKDELTKTTQLIYSYQAGKMVPRLREPRQLYGFSSELGPQTAARWPSEIEVLEETVKHIQTVPEEPEGFYKPTGKEKEPVIIGQDEGELVYHYEPKAGPFFMKSRVGGHKSPETSNAYVYQPKGNDPVLIFESRFESGNLSKVYKVGPYDYELWLRNDLYTNKHTQWFYFRVANTRANVTYRFTIVNLMKPDSLYNVGMRPLMYSEKDAAKNKKGWVRAGSEIRYYRNNLTYTMGKSEKPYYALTWTFQSPHDDDSLYFAHCYPYTYTDLQDYLLEISSDPIKSRICKQRVLCRTLAGNLVYVLTITSPSNSSENARVNKMKKVVVVTSRVHPGETNASWMMKGFLDYLIGNSADAKLLRDTFIFKIVPMLNPDGVIVGNYRCSLAGRDLNRNYKTVLKDSFPPVWHTKNMIKKLKEDHEIVAYCDLHGHSRKQNVFIYGCENKHNPEKRLRERIFPVMLGKNAPDKFSYESSKFKVQKSKEGTGRIVMWNMGIMNSYTMEATFCGSTLGAKKGQHFTTQDFEAMGFHFCDTLLDYCDPDNTKCANILLELEEKMKLDILAKLAKGENPNEVDLSDVDMSEIESSDGGSDSSVSDGLPVHLQYLAEKLPKRKKKLKTKKERDKHKCFKDKPTPQATPITEEEKPKPKPNPPIKYTTVPKRPKSSKDERTNNGIPMFAAERGEERAAKKMLRQMMQESDYLEALTNAYLRSGVLVNQSENENENDIIVEELRQLRKELPHFRYSTSDQDSRSNLPLEHLCPHHEKAFAAQYMAKRLALGPVKTNARWANVGGNMGLLSKQAPLHNKDEEYSNNLRRDELAVSKLLKLTRGGYVDDSEDALTSMRYTSAKGGGRHGSARGLPSPDQKTKHIVEMAANQQRREDSFFQWDHGSRPKSNREDSAIKQHPLPFDNTLDKEKTVDSVKQKGTNSAKNYSPPQVPVMLSPPRGKGTRSTETSPSKFYSDQAYPSESQTQLMDVSSTEQLTNGITGTTVYQEYSEPVHPVTETPSTIDRPSTRHGHGHQTFMAKLDDDVRMMRKQTNPPSRSSSGGSRGRRKDEEQHHMMVKSQSTNNMEKPLQHQQHHHHHHHHQGDHDNQPQHSHQHPHPQKPRAMSANSDISTAIESIQELKRSLATSARKANLSPTTGRYIERIMKQTDKEIETITADFQVDSEFDQQMESDFQQERREFSTSIQHARSPKSTEKTVDRIDRESNTKSYTKGKEKPLHARQNSEQRLKTPYSKPGERYSERQISDKNDQIQRDLMSGKFNRNLGVNNTDSDELVDEDEIPEQIDVQEYSTENTKMANGSANNSYQSSVKYRSKTWNQNGIPRSHTASGPTKISLMITRGHRDLDNPAAGYGSTFRPMSRSRPPLLRSLLYNRKKR